jgi:hypothetical protein
METAGSPSSQLGSTCFRHHTIKRLTAHFLELNINIILCLSMSSQHSISLRLSIKQINLFSSRPFRIPTNLSHLNCTARQARIHVIFSRPHLIHLSYVQMFSSHPYLFMSHFHRLSMWESTIIVTAQRMELQLR